jgi:hypothetical protein
MLARHTCNICGFSSSEIRNTKIHVSKSRMCSRNNASVVSSDIVLSNSDRRTGGREIISGSDSAAPDADEVPDTEAAPNSNGNSNATGSNLIQGKSGIGVLYFIVFYCLHCLILYHILTLYHILYSLLFIASYCRIHNIKKAKKLSIPHSFNIVLYFYNVVPCAFSRCTISTTSKKNKRC